MMRVNKKVLIGVIIVGLILFFSNPCLAGMTVQKVISNMQKVYEKQMKGINDYTVIQKNTGGMAELAGGTTTYYKKAKINGKVIYKTRTESEVMGKNIVAIYDGNYLWSENPMTGEINKKTSEHYSVQMWKNLDPAKTHYLGEEEIEGEKTYVLKTDDPFQIMGMGQMMSQQRGGSAGAWGKIWISSKTWMPVRMLIVIKVKAEERTGGMAMITKMTIDIKDYRQVSTMLHPYQTVMNMAMEMDTSGLSEEEKKEKEETMKMMSAMMSRMGDIKAETVDIKVNTGLSDDLFDGTKLK